MALKWTKDDGKKPSHLIQISRAMNEKEQISVSMYFDDPVELAHLLRETDSHLNAQESRWMIKQKIVEAKVAAADSKELAPTKKDKK